MAWCPNCKFEYVEGIKICPDCKTALVDSLEEADAVEMSDDEMAEVFMSYADEDADYDERTEMLQRVRNIVENPSYKPKKDKYEENRSGAGVLIVCGLLGIVALALNQAGILNIPLRGFSLILLYLVMGSLFVIFFISGILSIVRMKKLAPEVKAEEELIEKVLEFIKNNKESGLYKLEKNEEYELNYLELSDKVVKDINDNFVDLEPGFAFYVVDRFANEILDED